MPPQSIEQKKYGNDVANCVYFPEEIMLKIQTRLPVKSILRFKSVCKTWRKLFSSPEFIKLHRSQFSSDPKNQSLIIQEGIFKTNMYHLNIESGEKKPSIILDGPTFKNRRRGVVGCYNGLICTVFETRSGGELIVLWNPALKLFKSCLFENATFTNTASLGFGYDSEGDDFKVVRMTRLRPQRGIYIHEVEVYSVNSDSWTTAKVDFKISGPWPSNDVIVNGNPYWVAEVDGNEVLVCCDVTNLVCKIVPMLPISSFDRFKVKFVDWNGALGALVCNASVSGVWMFDDVVQNWRLKHWFGPIQGSVSRVLQFLKNENVVGQRPNDELFVFDPANECVEAIDMDEARNSHFEIYAYTESLTRINGMIRVGEEEEEDALSCELFGIDFEVS